MNKSCLLGRGALITNAISGDVIDVLKFLTLCIQLNDERKTAFDQTEQFEYSGPAN